MSEDGTRKIVEEYVRIQPHIRLIDNSKKTVSTALNLGIEKASGTVLMRADAHVSYPANYISRLVYWLNQSNADNVGCTLVTQATGNSMMSRAIAAGLGHPLGVGNSYFRVGVSRNRWVDTVPFGCYRKSVFEQVGKFDEDLIRNQDDEFNLRLIKNGGRILLVADVKCIYFARDSLAKLWRMYFQYGYFKPLVVRKVGKIMTVRQIVPAVFVLLVGVSIVAALISPSLSLCPSILITLYALCILSAALFASIRSGEVFLFHLCLVFAVLHFSYGIGYLRGVVDFLMLKKDPQSNLSSGLDINR